VLSSRRGIMSKKIDPNKVGKMIEGTALIISSIILVAFTMSLMSEGTIRNLW
jgi:hypothetical protein